MLDIMSQYGKVRQIDIPQEDPYRCEMEPSISGMKLHWFDGSFVCLFSYDIFNLSKILVTIF